MIVFYPNPLASMGSTSARLVGCACCISNMTRFMPSIPGYVYAQQQNKIYVNLYVANTATIQLPATKVVLDQETGYPWKGDVKLTVNPEKNAAFALHLRIPGWAKGKAAPGSLYSFLEDKLPAVSVLLNGKPVPVKTEKGFVVLNRSWKKGDVVSLTFPMEIQKIIANNSVKDDRQRFALQRGPLVYCLEGPDNHDSAVQNIVVKKDAVFTAKFEPGLLNGVEVLQAKGNSSKKQVNSNALLHTEQEVTAIPYYAWNNRGPAEMEVWIAYNDSVARPKPAPTIASKATVSSSQTNKRMLRGLNDQYEPADAQDHNSVYLHWWPNKGTVEWVQYDFDQAYEVSGSKVYWFDDGPFGGCRIPASWKIYYKSGNDWVPVEATTAYPVTKNKFDEVRFKPVTTTALKLEVQLPADNSAGLHEWIVE
ncbi:MAG: glycoside hydrolase family 127 protein [Flavihumibacter sp.]